MIQARIQDHPQIYLIAVECSISRIKINIDVRICAVHDAPRLIQSLSVTVVFQESRNLKTSLIYQRN